MRTVQLFRALGFGVVTLSLPFPASAGDPKLQKKLPGDDLSLDLPRPDQLFQVQSEENFRKRIREENLQHGVKKTEFPQDAQPTAKPADFLQIYPVRTIPSPSSEVCYRTLYFQDVTRERDLRSWGVAEPARELIRFYSAAVTLPAAMVVTPPWRYQCWQYPYLP